MAYAPRPLSDAPANKLVLVGGGTRLGTGLAARLVDAGFSVTIVSDRPPPTRTGYLDVTWCQLDVLEEDLDELPPGRLVFVNDVDPRPRWTWTLALQLPMVAARLERALAAREVIQLSSVAVYGGAALPLSEQTSPRLPWDTDALDAWCRQARILATAGGGVLRLAALCRRLAAADPSGEAVFAVALLAQEWLLSSLVDPNHLTILRLGEVHIDDLAALIASPPGPGVFNACLSTNVDTSRLQASGFQLRGVRRDQKTAGNEVQGPHEAWFDPPVRLSIPPRSAAPDELADRIHACLWRGELKHGRRWTKQLESDLRQTLGLAAEDRLVLTTSGTEALRLAIYGVAGRPDPGAEALLPSFTYPATAQVLLQLGYTLRFVDISPDDWTLDPGALKRAMARGRPRVVVCVDTFGNPCKYDELRVLCQAAGLPLIGDSAAGLGSLYKGRPVGTQAAAHAFSMSFAKVISAAGAGGAAVFRGTPRHDLSFWSESALMDEIHAVAAIEQLHMLEDLVARRTRIAEAYALQAACAGGIFPQQVLTDNRHSYTSWAARVVGRDMFAQHLNELGIETRAYFAALHRTYGHTGDDLTETEILDKQSLALPMSSELSEREVHAIGLAILAGRDHAHGCVASDARSRTAGAAPFEVEHATV